MSVREVRVGMLDVQFKDRSPARCDAVRMAAPSYVHGASDVPLLGETIGENLRRTVERHGDREALVVRQQGYRATYRELWEQTGAAARGLMARGVAAGDRV